ncbi:ATP-binding protein [Rubrivivax sp. RP6-9]|uniref:ATP-binding protein n=1 Tax=Rubrivivax sp. RP6-9 TaxID=3415750 RepID=UPI003CC56230
MRLLGAPALCRGDTLVPFAAERPWALLALLACRRDWVRRDELADLLYPERDLESARSNLRKVIHLARKLDGVGTLEQRGELLRWAPASDLERFEHACDAGRLDDAIAAYGGPLLLGLDQALPAETFDWLEAERRRLQSRWHTACTRRLAQLADAPAAAAVLAEAMLRHDPHDEAAAAALALARARAGPGAADGAATPAAAATALVGRRFELAELRRRLADPEGRLLVLTGPPGVGKSTLARAALAGAGPACCWVALADLHAADEVPPRVAARLGLRLDGSQPPWTALAAALGGGRRLLVLDNAEHLDLAAGLDNLLSGSGVQLLVASRASTGVAGEERLPLGGLPLPDLDETDPEVLRANDAVRLFELRARRVATSFDLAAEAPALVRLLHAVDGLPLAIELLAAWRRLMPVPEIVDELDASLEVLESAPSGERTLRAAFERSWQQLDATGQRVLSQLALLPQPVGRAMARQVLQAPLPVLATLVDRSLLQADGEGRFALHPLLRRCAAPRATGADAVRERHARDVADRLHAVRKASADVQLAAVVAEPEHVRSAWRWAVDARDAEVLRRLAGPLQLHDRQCGGWQEAIAQWQQALAALEPVPGTAVARARLLAGLADLQYAIGDLGAAAASALRCIELGTDRADDGGLADALAQALADAQMTLHSVHWQRGAYDEAQVWIDNYLAGARAAGDRLREAHGLTSRAMLDKERGRHEEALHGYEAARALFHALGDTVHLVTLLNNLGNLLRMMGRCREAIAALEEGLHWSRHHGMRADDPFLLTNLALVYEDLGHAGEAVATAARALASGREQAEPLVQVFALLVQARCEPLQPSEAGEAGRAMAWVWQALGVADTLGTPWVREECLVGAARALAARGEPRRAAALLQWVAAQPGADATARASAAKWLHKLGFDAATLATAAADLPADAPIERALAQLPGRYG